KMESIGTLAGGIAHDFNNILFPIVGHAEMLLEDIPNDSPLWESSNEILNSGLRAKELVKQILTFSRQDKGELKLMKLQPIIKEALKLIRSTIPTTIKINQDIRADCGAIKADPTQIHQIVMNIATNAYHAMEDTGGELTVKLKEVEIEESGLINSEMTPGLFACLTIADKGIGMDKELKNKIFDPFFTTKEQGKGTGLGLSVVHGIVTSMNGGIQIFSEPGKGTEFRIYFPLEKTYRKQNEETKQSIQGGTEHVLLVDDEKSIINMEGKMLERLGYQVTPYTDSLEALEAFGNNSEKFDVIISDLAMPNMAGEKLASEMLKIRPNIPIILSTGFSNKLTPEIAEKIGIKGVLLKPIVMNELSQTIRKVLGG
ncbi:MAG: response regulator, partial [Bacteroidetes bacterium]|nr:response regulator [Bacteroidota bacterium]